MLADILLSPRLTRLWQLGFWLSLGIILYLTLTPNPPDPIKLRDIDKLYHFIGFVGFTTLFTLAFPRLKLWLVIPLAALLGVAIELAQLYIPHRGFSGWDIVADWLGVLSGAAGGYGLTSIARVDAKV